MNELFVLLPANFDEFPWYVVSFSLCVWLPFQIKQVASSRTDAALGVNLKSQHGILLLVYLHPHLN